MEKKFSELFNPGDVICSDYFHNGKLLIVKEFSEEFRDVYKCEDMFDKHQVWCAVEERYSYHKLKYNWRLATDDDYVRELSKRMDSKYTLSNYTDLFVDDKGILLHDVMLNPKEAIELRNIIDKYVGG